MADRYRIDRLLARGGMAAVYLAQHVKLNRPVALKVLSPPPDAEARALIQAIDSRNHPRVWSLQELHKEIHG